MYFSFWGNKDICIPTNVLKSWMESFFKYSKAILLTLDLPNIYVRALLQWNLSSTVIAVGKTLVQEEIHVPPSEEIYIFLILSKLYLLSI